MELPQQSSCSSLLGLRRRTVVPDARCLLTAHAPDGLARDRKEQGVTLAVLQKNSCGCRAAPELTTL